MADEAHYVGPQGDGPRLLRPFENHLRLLTQSAAKMRESDTTLAHMIEFLVVLSNWKGPFSQIRPSFEAMHTFADTHYWTEDGDSYERAFLIQRSRHIGTLADQVMVFASGLKGRAYHIQHMEDHEHDTFVRPVHAALIKLGEDHGVERNFEMEGQDPREGRHYCNPGYRAWWMFQYLGDIDYLHETFRLFLEVLVDLREKLIDRLEMIQNNQY